MRENLIDALAEKNMLYFVLGGLISADELTDADACRNSLKAIESLKEELKSSNLKDDSKLKEQLDKAEEIVSKDLQDFLEYEARKQL